MQYIMELQAKKAEHEAAQEAALKASIDALPAAPAVSPSSLPQLAQRVLIRISFNIFWVWDSYVMGRPGAKATPKKNEFLSIFPIL